VLRYLTDRVAFTDKALRVNLDRLEREWEDYQSSRDRDGIYRYLGAVFELVSWWRRYDIAEAYARRAMCLRAGRPVDHVPEPFAAIILCTADPAKVDYRTRSKWSRALRYCARFKRRKEALTVFMRRKGGINRCALGFARRLGRAAEKSTVI
jgi:hypothetical protein